MNRYIKALILILIATFSFKLEVNAVYIHGSSEKWDGGHIKKIEDGHETDTYLYKLWVDDGTGAFCVDYGAEIVAGEASSTSLASHFEKGIDGQAAKDLAKEINEYLYFGYGNSGTSDKYYIATQKLIWEAISKSGFYKSSYYSSKIGSYNFNTLTFKYEGAASIDVSQEVSNIKSAINKYYITPSFCSSSNKLEIAVGETATYVDNNGVLSQYKVTCGEGLTCVTKGNDLKITAVSEGKDKTITFTKEQKGTDAALYTNGENNQGVVIAGGSMGPVSCNFGIDTYKNQQTSDVKIIAVILITILCGSASYGIYKSKKMLNKLK